MRILITTSTFPVALTDGGPRFVFDLARALSQHADVEVLAPHAPGAPITEQWDGVHVHRFRYFWPAGSQRLAYGGGMRENIRASWLARIQVFPLLVAETLALHRRVRSSDVEVVNSHWMVPQGLTGAWARGRRRRFRHVLHVHAADVYLLARLPFGRAIARFVLSRTDALLADGSHVRDALDELVGHPSGAVLQPMGAWVADFQAPVEPVVTRFAAGYLAFVGRLVEKKGVVHLLRAFARVHTRMPDLGLVVIGSGPLQEELTKEAGRLGIEAAVEFTGALPHPDVIRYLRGSRLAVVPSVIDSHGETDGMPTVVVEMMAAGLPVVGSDVDGIPDLITHGRNGWLARPGDVEDLADKLRLALDNHDAAVAESARATASEFDWSAVAEAYLAHLRPQPTVVGGGET
jgi:glycosyltransferase involved in cell wall biosynthesis